MKGPMKVLFLDVDGVLNSDAWFARKPTPKRFSVDPDCIARANNACKVSGAVAVLTSSWRWRMRPRHAIDLLRSNGLTATIVGITPFIYTHQADEQTDLNAPRGLEISQWLSDAPKFHQHVERFAIVDDKDDMGELHQNLVQTDEEIGITDDDVERVISLLT